MRIREATARRIVPVNVELGGKDPAYVRADADIPYVAAQIVDGAVFNSGQSCCSIERVYVHADVHDAFVAEVQKELKTYASKSPLTLPQQRNSNPNTCTAIIGTNSATLPTKPQPPAPSSPATQ